jgi:hypothetical protein
VFIGAGHDQEIDGQVNDAELRKVWLREWPPAKRVSQEISDGWAEEVAMPICFSTQSLHTGRS